MESVYEELINRVQNGQNFRIDFKKRDLIVKGCYLIRNGDSFSRELGCIDIPDFRKGVRADRRTELKCLLFKLEKLFQIYQHSVPRFTRDKRKTYFEALPLDKLTNSNLTTNKDREVARAALEGTILIAILKGCLYWDEELMGSWYWKSERFSNFIILKEWVVGNGLDQKENNDKDGIQAGVQDDIKACEQADIKTGEETVIKAGEKIGAEPIKGISAKSVKDTSAESVKGDGAESVKDASAEPIKGDGAKSVNGDGAEPIKGTSAESVKGANTKTDKQTDVKATDSKADKQTDVREDKQDDIQGIVQFFIHGEEHPFNLEGAMVFIQSNTQFFGQMGAQFFGQDGNSFSQGETSHSQVEEDPIAKKIEEDGFIFINGLFRRWVMAQTFRMLRYQTTQEEFRRGKNGFRNYLDDNYNYEYQFNVIAEELKTLTRLQKEGGFEYRLRKLFFTNDVVCDTCYHYLRNLKKQISSLIYKGFPDDAYVKEYDTYFNVGEVRRNVIDRVEYAFGRMIRFRVQEFTPELYREFMSFKKNFVDVYKLKSKTPKSPIWTDVYKSAGAFYTLANLLMSHGWFLLISGRCIYGEIAMQCVLDQLYTCYRERTMYKLFNLLLEVIRYNYDSQFGNRTFEKGNWLPIK